VEASSTIGEIEQDIKVVTAQLSAMQAISSHVQQHARLQQEMPALQEAIANCSAQHLQHQADVRSLLLHSLLLHSCHVTRASSCCCADDFMLLEDALCLAGHPARCAQGG
jgi:hypothetical protein